MENNAMNKVPKAILAKYNRHYDHEWIYPHIRDGKWVTINEISGCISTLGDAK